MDAGEGIPVGPGRLRRWLGRGVAALALTGGVVVAVPSVRPSAVTGADRPATARVTRGDLDTVVTAAGRLAAANSTEIRCVLERVSGVSGSTILKLVDDGSPVHKGDVLCELDASEYVELVRRQVITVEQARATFQQAELALQVARINLEAYKLGEMAQTDRLCQGQIALAESDLTRQKERLVWTRRMLDKGYLALGTVMTEEQALHRAEIALKQTKTSYELYQRFTAPKMLRALESDINQARADLDFQTIRLRREEERLALYRKMVEGCTVRAPHDGLAILANRSGRSAEVYEGATVRQRQPLFTLPDLSLMEVEVMLHETVVSTVQPGLPVRVRVEAVPDRDLTGTVIAVAPLPFAERRQESGNSDVTYFVGRVRLDQAPPGLRPGMSAELEVLTGRRSNALTVPAEAIAPGAGKNQGVCLVTRADRPDPEPRNVTVGLRSHDRVEITAGLSEGETVLLAPPPDPNRPAKAEALSRPSSNLSWKDLPPPPPRDPAAKKSRRGFGGSGFGAGGGPGGAGGGGGRRRGGRGGGDPMLGPGAF